MVAVHAAPTPVPSPPPTRSRRPSTAALRVRPYVNGWPNQLKSEDEHSKNLCGHNATGIILWNGIVLQALLLYTVIVTPLQIGHDLRWSFSRTVDIIVDVGFIVNVLLIFRTTVVQPNGKEVRDKSKIAALYCKSYFLVDTVAAIPWNLLLDLAAPHLWADQGLWKTPTKDRVLRGLMLIKLLRVIQAKRSSQAMDEFFVCGNNQRKFSRLAILVLSFSHIAACMWSFLIGIDPEGDVDSALAHDGLVGHPLVDQYLSGLYWTVSTVTTVGYGDISAVTDTERLWAMVIMCVGSVIYAYFISVMTSAVTNYDHNSHQYNRQLSEIKNYCIQRDFPEDLFQRVIAHIRYYFQKKTALDELEILDKLSVTLQAWEGSWTKMSREVSERVSERDTKRERERERESDNGGGVRGRRRGGAGHRKSRD